MPKTVAQMTTDELRRMMGELIEAKLLDIFGDPDEGLELREEMEERLARQREQVAAGERGAAFGDVVRQLGLG